MHIEGHADGRAAVDYSSCGYGVAELTGPMNSAAPVFNAVLPAWDLIAGMTATRQAAGCAAQAFAHGEGRTCSWRWLM